jgi:hypothetical protein
MDEYRMSAVLKTIPYRLFYLDADYPLVFNWWKKHNEVPLAPELLSDLGVIYQEEGIPMASTWIYLSNSKGAQVGWTVVDPDLTPRKRMVAVSNVLMAAEQVCRDHGCQWMISFSNDSSLSKLMSFQGFKSLKAHDFLIKELAPERTKEENETRDV